MIGIWLFGTSIIIEALGSADMRMAVFLVGIGLLGCWGGIWFLTGWLKSGTQDQSKISLERQPAETYSNMDKKDVLEV